MFRRRRGVFNSGVSEAGLVENSFTSANTGGEGTSLEVPIPLDFSVGDTLINVLHYNDNANAGPGLSATSGWTLAEGGGARTILIPTAAYIGVNVREADGTETATYTHSWTNSGAMYGYSFAIKGVNSTVANNQITTHNDYDNWPGEIAAHSGTPVSGGLAVIGLNLLSQNSSQGVVTGVPTDYTSIVDQRSIIHGNSNGHGRHQVGIVTDLTSVEAANTRTPFTHSGMVASGGCIAGWVLYFDPA